MSSEAKKKYRYVDTVPGELLSGRPVAPGDFVELTKKELDSPHNKELVETGKLIPVEQKEGSK